MWYGLGHRLSVCQVATLSELFLCERSCACLLRNSSSLDRWSEGDEEEEKSDDDEGEEYDDDDDFVGGSEKDQSEGENEQLSTGIDYFSEEEDGVLDIEIEGFQQSRVDGHKTGEKQDEVLSS